MTATAHGSHRVLRALAGVRESLGEGAGASVWSMSAGEAAAGLSEVQSARAQLAALEARLLVQAHAADAPGLIGATSTPNWFAHHTRVTRPQAHRQWRLASGLESHQLTRAALEDGALQVEQAEAVLGSLAELPEGLHADQVHQVEAHLLDLARDFDAKQLRLLGRRAVEVIDPEAAEAHEAKLLEREERAAAAATSLVIWDDQHGKTHGRFTLDTVTGAALKKALLAIAAPQHRAATDGEAGEPRPTAERLGAAFTEYLQRYPADQLPRAGGLNATVVVLMPLETLMGGLRSAQLDTGEMISPGAARRFACEAGIIPAVLGGSSEVLDLGHERRFHNKAQRLVATIEQRGCAVEGCDYPPGMTHMHHPVRWADGGQTNRDAIMICPPHHARAHDPRYTMTRLPTGKHSFHRRT